MRVSSQIDENEVSGSAPQVRRANVLGVGVSVACMKEAVNLSDQLLRSGQRGYICAADVHTIIEAQSNLELRNVLNRSFLTTADGMPLVWVGRMQGYREIDRIYGPDFMLEMCEFSSERGYKHFLYGGKPGVAEQLKVKLTSRFPSLQIVGTFTPPFRPLNTIEEAALVSVVAEAKPDIFWVGLGSPKQDHFMAQYFRKLDARLFVGVGAAFDFHSGSVREAPNWLKRSGFQWAFRLIQEPRRLWRRYLYCVPAFIWKITLQLTGIRRPELAP